MSASSNQNFHTTHLQPKTLFLTNEPGLRSTWEGLAELKRTILADGLRTPLRVRQVSDSHYKIVHGRRRYMAIVGLIGEGHASAWRYVPCNIKKGGDDADDLVEYLGANLCESLPPALVNCLFSRLFDMGLQPDEIAVRAGLRGEVVDGAYRSAQADATSIVSLTLGRHPSSRVHLPTAERTQTCDDLIAAICASVPAGPARRRVLTMTKLFEAFFTGDADASETVVQLLGNEPGAGASGRKSAPLALAE